MEFEQNFIERDHYQSIEKRICLRTDQKKSDNDKKRRSSSRHKTSPKQKMQIPSKYLINNKSNENSISSSSNEMFTFQKSSQQNKNFVIENEFKKKLIFGQQKKHLRSSAEVKETLIQNNKTIVTTPLKRFSIANHDCEIIDIQFDFGHLDRPKSIQKLQHHQSVFPPKKKEIAIPNSSIHKDLESNKKLNQIIYQKQLKFQSHQKPLKSNTHKKKFIKQKINNQINTKKKRGSSQCSDHHQRQPEIPNSINPNVLSINQKNLKFDNTIDPQQKRKNSSRIITMFSNGKIKTKIINYPDVSHYLKLCGIRN